ncbi:putative bifunctional diguanylate cyclase/phosphodiesterase [Sulfuriferula thiophila]|uniref:putative bifunctional diguanylate cyclase/phosphodiesterase n=1 Tax=Sulfuriferula thiophila TaxID=1781211 RepID=UPI000F613201|nr:bifunctional diguanylate cyclase/phosphodiesterase [Sulfuriferula thiophila]
MLRSSSYARVLLKDEHTRNLAGWRLLFGFVILFVLGYIGYGLTLLTRPAALADIVVSGVFFSGGLFVLVTMHVSVQTLHYVREIMKRERHGWLHDSLTNLPNRRLLMERIEQAITIGNLTKKPIAIMIMDLNRFKEVNDTLGHHYGDELLIALAQRLHGIASVTCMVARMGGDEFGFALEATNKKEAVSFSKHVLAIVDEPFVIDGHKLSIGGSIGIAMYPEHGDVTQQLLQHADVAMYAAKRSGNGYVMYAAGINESSLSNLNLIATLKHPDLKDQLSICYQPKINLKDGTACGLEALVRWNHPVLGSVSPEQFIPIAERIGVMKQITFTVLHAVLAQLEEWHALGLNIKVAVNLSMRNLSDESLPDDIARALTSYNIPPSSLILEVTESSMMINPELANATLTTLSELGVQCSIDDFGTGYSSLAYLKSLPAAEIKIDKSFVTNMTTDDNDAIIVHATIVMAHNMGYRVVAEGVETAEVLELLQILGCDVVQGYYFSKPIPADAVPEWIVWHNKQSQRYVSSRLALR